METVLQSPDRRDCHISDVETELDGRRLRHRNSMVEGRNRTLEWALVAGTS